MVNVFKTFKNVEKFSSPNNLVEIPKILRGRWEEYDVMFPSDFLNSDGPRGIIMSSREFSKEMKQKYTDTGNRIVISNSKVRSCLKNQRLQNKESPGLDYYHLDYNIDGKQHKLNGKRPVGAPPLSDIKYTGKVSNNSILFTSVGVNSTSAIPSEIYFGTVSNYNDTKYLVIKYKNTDNQLTGITIYNKINDSTNLVCSDHSNPTTTSRQTTSATTTATPSTNSDNNKTGLIIGLIVGVIVIGGYMLYQRKSK
jgi:LPXTG-motif cell wall-anchored protein